MEQELLDWVTLYVQQRDLLRREIVELKKQSGGFDLVEKRKQETLFYKIQPTLHVPENTEQHLTIVTLNTKKNFDFLLAHWKQFIQYRYLRVLFVNLKEHKKWMIYPATHEKIASKGGLQTLFKSCG